MRSAAVLFAAGLYLAMGLFPYLASALLAPPVGVAFLMLAWAAGLVPVVTLTRRRSLWVLAAPVAAGAFWAVVVTVGERAFGWTA